MHTSRAAAVLLAVLSMWGATAHAAPALPAAGACPEIPLAGADAAAVRTPSAADAWGGARGGSEATLSNRVVAYSIDAELDPVKHTIKGKQALTWRNRSAQPVCSVYLHLYLNGFEGHGSTFMTEQRASESGFRSDVDTKDGEYGYIRLDKVAQGGAAAKWRFVQPDGGPKTDRSVVRIDLPQPVAPGASTTLDIDFFDQLPRVVARTGYYGSFHLVAQWFPKIGVLELPGERGATAPRWNAHEFHLHSEFYADFGSYDVRITVPRGYTVGSTGVPKAAPVEKGGKVTHNYVQDDVHDFAWTADKRYAKPMTQVWNGPNGPVQVSVLYTPEYASNAKPVLQATIDSLKYFSDTLGGYPYKSATAVIPPYGADEAGGMEYPTFFTADSTAQDEPGTPGRFALDFVTVHEFGHGYFYGILASNEFEEPYLDEGMNEYWDQRMMTARKQDIVLTKPWMQLYGIGTRIAPFEMERLGASLGDPADPLGGNSWERLSSGSYNTVYTRTATAMRQIEALVGTPAMERAMKLYYARWKFRHPSTADLQAALAEGTGRADIVDAAFDAFIYGTGKVDDRVSSIKSEEILPLPGYRDYKGQRVLVGGKQIDKAIDALREKWKKAHPKAKAWEGAFPYRSIVVVRRDGLAVPQTLRVKFADGSQRDMAVTGSGSWQRFVFVGPAKAVSAQLDPDDNIRLDSDELNDSRTAEANGDAARRWFRDFAMLLQSLFALLATV
ncbi:M1 family metallopeptidase [Thermomonas aquatica]|uniref:M1 family metallopeptidase n=1 Tax=Thermomonas aquatica TaxID=2202149 RepID=A0A5B7ZMS7_9GAMM|nr:M1 family metallopeptidase [Thermomonas aquatica]QDA56594.1 M1 family metallopeptidase [Thermomonas aquatica]